MIRNDRELPTYNHGMAPSYWKYSWGQLPYGVKTLPRSDDIRYLPERWVTLERRIWQNFIEKISHLNKRKILDLGCGAGKLIQFLFENNATKENIFAIDENAQLIKWCSNVWPLSTFIVMDVTKIDQIPQLKQKKFDLITAHMLFNLLDDTQLSTVVLNAFNQLNQNGILAIQIPSIQGKLLSYPNLSYKGDKTQLLQEITPWGTTPYYHRSEAIMRKLQLS